MKAKEHEDKETAMHELEKYTEELANEVTDMLHWASAEEKTMLQSKMNALIAKIK
jgi:transcriptional regulator of NAD metabolism